MEDIEDPDVPGDFGDPGDPGDFGGPGNIHFDFVKGVEYPAGNISYAEGALYTLTNNDDLSKIYYVMSDSYGNVSFCFDDLNLKYSIYFDNYYMLWDQFYDDAYFEMTKLYTDDQLQEEWTAEMEEAYDAVCQELREKIYDAEFDALLPTLCERGREIYNGTYTLKEVSAPEGLAIDDTEYTIRLEFYKIDWFVGVGFIVDDRINYDEEYGSYYILDKLNLDVTAHKTVNGKTPADGEVFEFGLRKIKELNWDDVLCDVTNSETVTVKNQGGTITFDLYNEALKPSGDDIRVSLYLLSETSASSEEYTMDDTEYLVVMRWGGYPAVYLIEDPDLAAKIEASTETDEIWELLQDDLRRIPEDDVLFNNIKNQTDDPDIPETGDSANMALLLAVAMLSAGGIVLVAKKRKENE